MVFNTNIQTKKAFGSNSLEVSHALGDTGKYQIVELFNGQILDTLEFTNSLQEVSGRIEYLNNRSWKTFFMVRKLS